MAPFLAGRGLRFIIWGSLAASTSALTFNFTDVQQCEQVAISFTGPSTMEIPFTLSVIPFDSTVITFPLPNPALATNGIALTSLPLLAGSNFIASLDSATGKSIIDVSDIIQILPSANNSTDCLPTNDTIPPRLFKLASLVSQCEEFTIEYDTSEVSSAPDVRLYNPNGPSFSLELVLDSPASGSATYMMNFDRGKDIVLTMGSGAAVKESTTLLTVQGNVTSSTSCLNTSSADSGDGADLGSQDRAPSRALVIGAAVGGVFVVLVGIWMGIFVMRDRRQRKRLKSLDFDPSRMEKASQDLDETDMSPTRPQRGTVVSPLYTYTDFISPTKPIYPRSTVSSWAQAMPGDQERPFSPFSSNSVSQATIRSVDRLSIQSLDIEGMLNMATIQAEAHSSNSAHGAVFPSNIPDRPTAPADQIVLRPQISGRHLRNPSDVPVDLRIREFSGFSVNPFASSPPPSITGPIMDPEHLPSRSGLPGPPQEGLKPSRARILLDSNQVSYAVMR